MPYIQCCILDGSAALTVKHDDLETQRDAGSAFGDVLADKPLVNVIGTLLLLGREHATGGLDAVL